MILLSKEVPWWMQNRRFCLFHQVERKKNLENIIQMLLGACREPGAMRSALFLPVQLNALGLHRHQSFSESESLLVPWGVSQGPRFSWHHPYLNQLWGRNQGTYESPFPSGMKAFSPGQPRIHFGTGEFLQLHNLLVSFLSYNMHHCNSTRTVIPSSEEKNSSSTKQHC